MPAKSSKAEQSGQTARWPYLLLPSALDIFFITLLFGLSCGALGRLLLRDAGIGWHIRNGEQILQTHAVPHVDPFSSTLEGKAWYAWEWLFDLLIAVIHHVFGLNGVVFYTAAIIAVTFVLALYLAQRRGSSLPITLLLLILTLAASAVHFLARPHVVSWLFTVMWFYLVDSADADQHRGRLYWLPVLMVFWVNLHGGFVLGFGLLAVYLAAAAIEYLARSDERVRQVQRLKHLALTTVLVFAASFVNPYGYQLHLHVYRYLSDRFLMDRISEFLSPDFHGAAQQCFAALLLITLVAMASAHRRPPLSHLLVVLFAAYGGFYATRNLPASSLLITLVIAPIISESVKSAGSNPSIAPWFRRVFSYFQAFSDRVGNIEIKLEGHLWLVAVFVLGLWACTHHGRIGSTQFINAYFDAKRFPVEATEAVVQRHIGEPIFGLDYWGGYLIYRLYPQAKVVVDDRHDFYGDQFFKDYLRLVLVQPGWDRVLKDLHVEWVLMPAESPLANMLRLTPGWDTSYEDQRAVLFHRSRVN